MKTITWIGLAVALTTACGSGGAAKSHPAPTAPDNSTALVSPSTAPEASYSPRMNGNAATNVACKLLTLEQVTTLSGLNVTGLLGLPTQGVPPAKTSESCTWYLDSTEVQASLVVQYTLFPNAPADLKAYYPQVIKQGFGTAVPKLGDISKINKHALDTIYRRAEIHVTLLRHAETTREDQTATIAFMRLVMPGISQ